jgi:hypothetical protein
MPADTLGIIRRDGKSGKGGHLEHGGMQPRLFQERREGQSG